MDVFPGVYPPAEDTYLLADAIAAMGARGALRGRKFLDMGCGTGYVGIVAGHHGARVTFADINPVAVKNALHNAAMHGVSANGVVSDLFSNVRGVFDVVAFNPPYLPVDGEDPSWSGGRSGVEVTLRFVSEVSDHLARSGIVLLVLSTLADVERVIDALNAAGLCPRTISRRRLFFEELIVLEGRACR